MSLSGAFQNAVAGLRANSRTLDLLAQNISNATTPGFARREIQLASTSDNLIGGVTVTGITRAQDVAMLNARRDADAELGHSTALNAFFSRYETTLGTPDHEDALTNLVADFDSKLLSAASRPDAPERLHAAVQAAQALVVSITDTSQDVSDMRRAADEAIEAQVNRLNAALEEVEYLNLQIEQAVIGRREPHAIIDLRQSVIDEIHEIVPLRVLDRELGAVALLSQGGTILLDGAAREVEFSAANGVTPNMSVTDGSLSGITIDEVNLTNFSAGSNLAGGTLAAQFLVRDQLATDALDQLDAMARNLIERFQDPAVDSTLATGDAGLFTDRGLAFDPANEAGLSERLQLNALVDPAQGGETWRLRDGMNAATPGNVGQSALLNALSTALNAQISPTSGDFGTGTLSMSNLANGLMSRVGVQRLSAEQNVTFAASAQFELAQQERAAGVDTDAELQQMLVIEKAYAANARMLQAADEMLETLLGI
jgi:flagellar hook-associated protein 1 FlgK